MRRCLNDPARSRSFRCLGSVPGPRLPLPYPERTAPRRGLRGRGGRFDRSFLLTRGGNIAGGNAAGAAFIDRGFVSVIADDGRAADGDHDSRTGGPPR